MLPFLLAMALEPLPTAPNQVIAQANSSNQQNATVSSYPYASINFGAGFPWNYDGSFDLLDSKVDTSLKLNGGFTGELALGYKFNQARAEVAWAMGPTALTTKPSAPAVTSPSTAPAMAR